MKFHFYDIEINENFLYRLLNNTKYIKLRNIRSENNITRFSVESSDIDELFSILEELNIQALKVEEKGIYEFITRLPVIKAVLFFLAVFTLLLYINSMFIWNISIDGNYSYTSSQIVNFINKQDIKEGKLKNAVDCESLEKKIRKSYNDISWVCAEIKGTNLIVHIKENYITEISNMESDPYNIVANKDAEIVSVLVRKGKANVKKGDKIKKGHVLISGMVDVFDESEQKLFTNVCNADGEIIGKTKYVYTDKLNINYKEKINIKKRNIYLPSVAGYKWLNIGDNKDKNIVYSEKKFKAFGNYYVPFILQKYTIISYDMKEVQHTKKSAEEILTKKLLQKLTIMEQKGYKIMKKNVRIRKEKNHFVLSGEIECYEPLGKVEYIDSNTINEIESENSSISETQSENN